MYFSGIATGWGKTSNQQQTVTAKLRYLITDIISNEDCKAVDADYSKIVQPSILCISGKQLLLFFIINQFLNFR